MIEPPNSAFTLNKYWQVVKRRWIPGFGVFIPVCIVSVLASSWKKTTYEAVGKLLLHGIDAPSSTSGLEKGSDDVKTGTRVDNLNFLNTEIEIITSTLIVQKTIDSLHLKDQQGNPLSYGAFLERLTVKDIQGTNVLKVAYRDREPEMAATVVNTLVGIYLEQKQSDRQAQKASTRQFIEKQLKQQESNVRQAETKLADFQSKNHIISLQAEATKSVETIADLQKQIGEIRARMANVSAQVKELRTQLRINAQQAVTFNSLSQVEGVQAMVTEIQQLESQLAQQRLIFQDDYPEIQKMESKLNTLKAILSKRIEKAGSSQQINTDAAKQPLRDAPKGSRAKRDRNFQVEEQQLAVKLVELESIRLGLASELATLSTLEQNYRLRYNQLPQLDKEQRQLERQVNAAQSTYLYWLKKLQEARTAEAQIESNISQLSVATVPEEPIDSRIPYYWSGVLLSAVVGVMVMCILEARDKTVKNVEEAKELLELPVLGVIPLWEKRKLVARKAEEKELSLPMLVMKNAPTSLISEAYRMLRANLNFVSADKEMKVIVVTSSVPREGKSTVAANLAIAMTQGEHSVLLIDGDLHHSSQHQVWNVSNQHGLSSVIMGEVEVMKAIKKVSNYLDVLTSGEEPCSPTSILDCKRVELLLDSFASYYDYVIIDAPSLNLAVDAMTLGRIADGVLLVVRPGLIDYKNAIAASELLRKSGQNVIGQVVNAIATENDSLSKYYFREEYQPQDSVAGEAKQTT